MIKERYWRSYRARGLAENEDLPVISVLRSKFGIGDAVEIRIGVYTARNWAAKEAGEVMARTDVNLSCIYGEPVGLSHREC